MRYLIFIFVLLCLLLAFGCEEEYTYRPFPSPETASTTTTVPPPTTTTIYLTVTTTVYLPETTSPSSATTFNPINFTGSGDEKTAPFYIPAEEWVIDWSYVPDPEYPEYADFSFYIYPRGETIFYVEVFLYANQSGSSYSYAGSGEYYIEVSAYKLEYWNITIKPPP